MLLPLLLLGFVGPAPVAEPASVEPASAEAAPRVDYDTALDKAEVALEFANTHYKRKTKEAIRLLEEALPVLEAFKGELRRDEGGRAILIGLELNLARALLKSGDRAKALDIMGGLVRLDIIMRAADPNSGIPFSAYGDDALAIREEQMKIIESLGKATVEIICHQSCLPSVDGLPVYASALEPGQPLALELYLASYRVEAHSTETNEPLPPSDGGAAGSSIALTEKGAVVTLEFGERPEPPPLDCELTPDDPQCPICEQWPDDPRCPICEQWPDDPRCPICEQWPDDPRCPPPTPNCKLTPDDPQCPICEQWPEDPRCLPPTPKRMLPRWAEVSGIVVGVGLAATGGGMLSVDGKCKNFDPPETLCPDVWESTAGGIVSVGVGAALAITGTVLLIIDEKRARKPNDRKVTLTPTGTLRF